MPWAFNNFVKELSTEDVERLEQLVSKYRELASAACWENWLHLISFIHLFQIVL